MADTRICAFISAATKQQVERYVEAHGVKEGFLVEEALLHHLQALRELPSDIVIPPRLTVTRASFETVEVLIKKPRRATKALRDLMAGLPNQWGALIAWSDVHRPRRSPDCRHGVG